MAVLPYVTDGEVDEVIDGLDVGDRKPLRRLMRKAFWWGFTHPFTPIPPITETVMDRLHDTRGCDGTCSEPVGQCAEEWAPAAGGPGYRCCYPAGHDGPHAINAELTSTEPSAEGAME